MRKRYFGRKRFFNCGLFVFILLLKGRLSGVAFYPQGWKPPHVVGITRRGRFVHFRTLKTRECAAPLWFEGRPHVYRERRTGAKAPFVIRWSDSMRWVRPVAFACSSAISLTFLYWLCRWLGLTARDVVGLIACGVMIVFAAVGATRDEVFIDL